MDLLYPDKKDIFESFVADFTPAQRRPPSVLLLPSSQITRRIDADIARLDELSRALKAERNEYVPILRILPVDVLKKIIEICARSDPPDPMPIREGRSTAHTQMGRRAPGWLGWARLGQVCQRLRRVIFAMPELWASVAFLLPRGHAEILARARDAPITITLLGPRIPPELLQSAEARLSSARNIHLDLDLPDVRSMFDVVLASGQAFAALEELDLSVGNVMQTVTREVVDLPPLRAPSLRHLKLQNCFVPCTYSSLETLHIRFQHTTQFTRVGDETAGPHFQGEVLLDVLRRCISLRRLYLGGRQLEELPTPSSPHATASLPRLEWLSMTGTAAFCRSIWDNLILDPHIRVEITFERVRRPPEAQWTQEVALISTILHRIRETGIQRITGLRLDCLGDLQDIRLAVTVNRVGAFTDEREGPFAEGRVFALDVQYLFSRQPTLFKQMLSDLPRLIDLSGVDTLALSPPRGTNILTTAEWRTFLAPFHAVRNFVCDEFPPQRSLWDAICPPANAADVTPVLPSLHTLFVTPANPHRGFKHTPTAPHLLVPWDDVLAGFIRRSEREIGIDRMVLGMYWDMAEGVDPEMVAALRSVVLQVVDNRQCIDGHETAAIINN